MSFLKFLMETPIRDMERVGDFEKNHGFDARDRKLIGSDKTFKNIKKKFDKSDIDIDMYFVNKTGVNQHMEKGLVSPDFIEKEIDEELGKKIKANIAKERDGTTVVFVGNRGAEKVPMTPWIIAHRFAHAIAREHYKGKQGKIQSYTDMVEAIRDYADEMADIYRFGSFDRKLSDRRTQLFLREIFYSIATFRSARERKLRDYFEIFNELISQYFITGKVTFNKPPKVIGNKRTNYSVREESDYQDAIDLTNMLEDTLEHILMGLEGELHNRVFVM